MTTTIESTRPRWTRFIPRQFSLRVLLVVITISAGFVWWAIQPRGEGIHPEAAHSLKLGMTTTEVRSMLGTPEAGNETYELFIYRVKVPIWSRQMLFIEINFEDDRVSSLEFHSTEPLAWFFWVSKGVQGDERQR